MADSEVVVPQPGADPSVPLSGDALVEGAGVLGGASTATVPKTAPFTTAVSKTAVTRKLARRLHRYSACVLGAFILVHLVTHLFMPFGPEAHRQALALARWLYRTPLSEPILITSVLIQVVSGARLLRGGVGGKRARLRRWTGGYLLFFLIAHTGAAMFQRFGLGADTDFYWAAGVLRWPLVLFFAPYYALGISCFVVHLGMAAFPKVRVSRWVLASVGFTTIVLLGLAGVFTPFAWPEPPRVQ